MSVVTSKSKAGGGEAYSDIVADSIISSLAAIETHKSYNDNLTAKGVFFHLMGPG